MNKKGVIAEKTGFYIIFIFLFTFAFVYAVSFLKVSNADVDTNEIEDSIVATKVINCFSNDKYFDESKMSMDNLGRCFYGDKYFLKITLRKENGENVLAPYGDLNQDRSVKRYVALENGNGILEINYKKNLRRYENAA